ncbi:MULTISPECIES: flagellar basal body-associated protein FliL [Massilia]|uniref:Flagellar protein FliL n=1 Tax=Massilia haematophila TaxID=457923 RepID=A0ABV7PM06_9BURK|nr:flagellar basal body-associated protein FliL [Massilia sp.]HBZ06888.1 flagellar basal body-associated protein FliL [Massilia sp.]
MKANPKTKSAPAADAAAPAGGSKKKLMIIAIAGVLLLGGGAGAGWYFLHGSGDAEAHEEAPKKKKKEKKAAVKSEYVPIEQFVVNLQPGDEGDQYLQIQFTLQVDGPEQALLVKDNMAKVRSRVLMLLSGKKASEINTIAGKQQLAAEIKAVVQAPFDEHGDEQEVSDVLFTSFIIQ